MVQRLLKGGLSIERHHRRSIRGWHPPRTARTMLLTRRRKTARASDRAIPLPCRPSGRSCAPGGADRANCRAADCRRRHQRRRAGPAVIRRSSGAIGVTLSAYPTNSVFTRALSSCWTRFSPLIMHLRVHLSWIIIVAPPSDIAISLVPGAGVPGNGTAAIGIIEAVVARFLSGGQQSLAMLPNMILDLSAGHGEGIGGGCG